MISNHELQAGGLYVLHNDEDEGTYRICKVITIAGRDMWVILCRDCHPEVPSGLDRDSSVVIRTSAEAFITWGATAESRFLRVEAVTPEELASRDFTLYPENPLVRVDPRSVRSLQ